jgi:hypothetical protein
MAVESVFDSWQEKTLCLLHSNQTGTMTYFSEDNGPRRRAMDSLPSRGKVKKYGVIRPFPTYLHGV